MKLVTLDFETAYSREFSLSKMSTEAYVNDDRFEVIGVSIAVDNEEPHWYPSDPDHSEGATASLKSGIAPYFAGQTGLLCQNTMFDALILAVHYDIYPDMYFDTMSMARPLVFPKVGRTSLAAKPDAHQGDDGDQDREGKTHHAHADQVDGSRRAQSEEAVQNGRKN